jgi:hypothetical protein
VSIAAASNAAVGFLCVSCHLRPAAAEGPVIRTRSSLRRTRVIMALLVVVLAIGFTAPTTGAAASGPLAGPACFAAHKQSGPLTTLAQAQACAPGATVYTSTPALVTGMTAIIHSGKFYEVVYATASTQPSAPAAAASSCGRYWRNFSQQNWWFGNAAGRYQPYGYQYFSPWGCSWYANMTANNFYFSWCVCAGWGASQGTYDSNWANAHGYGWWATAWVNGYFLTPIPVYYGFTCRGQLYPNGALSYPGCQMG